MKTLSFFLLTLCIVFACCTAPPAEQPQVEDTAQKEADLVAMYRMPELWDAAEKTGNIEGILDLLTDDYIRMEAEMPVMVGKEAFRDFLESFYEKYSAENSKNTVVEVRLAGDWAYARGTWEGTVVPKTGGDKIQLTGKWIDIRERQEDGSWKISRCSSSLDQPFEF